MKIKFAILIASILMLAACWNGGNSHISLGNVSIGQQMIDLKTALEAGALSQSEYDQLRETLLSIETLCQSIDKGDQ